jgi:hypothetical protein
MPQGGLPRAIEADDADPSRTLVDVVTGLQLNEHHPVCHVAKDVLPPLLRALGFPTAACPGLLVMIAIGSTACRMTTVLQ